MSERNGIRLLPSGRWQARYRFAPGPTGCRTETFEQRHQARAWLDLQRAGLVTGVGIDPRHGQARMGAYFDDWLERQQIVPTSRATYLSQWRSRLEPTFGSLRLADVTVPVVQRWQARTLADGLEPSTVGGLQTLLGMVVQGAVADGLLADNPVRRVRRPKVATRDYVEADPGPIVALLDHAPAHLVVALDLAVGAGLRSGELRGLTVDRVDFGAGVLTIDRQLVRHDAGHQFAEGEWHHGRDAFGPPKGGRTRRVPVEPAVVDSIERHLRLHRPGVHGLIVTGRRGGPMGQSLWDREWQMLCDVIGLEGYGVHQLRHAYASWLIAEGEPVANVSRNLGHASVAFTLNRYTRPDVAAAPRSVLGRLARGPRVARLTARP